MNKSAKRNSSTVIPLMLVGIVFFVIGFGVGISGFLLHILQEVRLVEVQLVEVRLVEVCVDKKNTVETLKMALKGE